MYRQNSSCSDVVPPPTPDCGVPAEPTEDDLGPAERGEAPPLREVSRATTSINIIMLIEGPFLKSLSLLFPQVSVKFGDNHRFCNIKVNLQLLHLVN